MGQGLNNPPVFFVDSNILIRHIRQKQSPTIYEQAIAKYGTAVVSEIVIFELEVGARRAGRQFEFQTHFNHLTAYPMIATIWVEAAKIHATLLSQNQTIGIFDTFIAATAIHHHLPLFTLNSKHFQRVTGLTLLPMP